MTLTAEQRLKLNALILIAKHSTQKMKGVYDLQKCVCEGWGVPYEDKEMLAEINKCETLLDELKTTKGVLCQIQEMEESLLAHYGVDQSEQNDFTVKILKILSDSGNENDYDKFLRFWLQELPGFESQRRPDFPLNWETECKIAYGIFKIKQSKKETRT
jgi:hypothetical protein